MAFKSKKCEICGKEFEKNDDIVVCPECGAPFHRNCYKDLGKCPYEHLHGTDDQWIGDASEALGEDEHTGTAEDGEAAQPIMGNDESSEAEKRCKACGNDLRENARFCDRCGAPVIQNPENAGYIRGNAYPAGVIMPQIELVDMEEDIADGVTMGDVSKYVKVNKQYYMLIFSRIKKFKMSRFNFVAFLFTGGWMMYRKQYLKGAIIAVIVFLLMLASGFIYSSYSVRILTDLLDAAGLKDVTMSNMQMLYPYIENLGRKDLSVLILPYIIELIRFVIMIVVGIKANKSYLNHCIKQVKKIKSENITSEQIDAKIDERGGVNSAIAACMIVCYILVKYLPPVIMQ